MKNKKIYSFLGLAMKAGKLASGEVQVEHAVKAGKAFLVIVAADASENTRKKFGNMCEHYRTPICCFGRMEELGASIGKELRSSLAVMDENMATKMMKQINSETDAQSISNE